MQSTNDFSIVVVFSERNSRRCRFADAFSLLLRQLKVNRQSSFLFLPHFLLFDPNRQSFHEDQGSMFTVIWIKPPFRKIEFCCRKMSFNLLIIIITIFIVLPSESYALSPILSFRHLLEQTNVSPSPSPSYLASGGSNIQQSCNRASRSCQMKNITACLVYSQNEICLFVHNNGEDTQHMKIMILPAKTAIKEINITSHQAKKVKFSSDVDLSSAIMLTTSDGDCVITTAAALSPENRYQKHSSYVSYITPINGAYLVILLLITGLILTFFKLRARGRHLEGVLYHELELGNSTVLNMEENETENWDQDWNDEWGDEKPVKSGGDIDNHVLVKKVNDLTTKLPNSNGRKKEWDD